METGEKDHQIKALRNNSSEKSISVGSETIEMFTDSYYKTPDALKDKKNETLNFSKEEVVIIFFDFFTLLRCYLLLISVNVTFLYSKKNRKDFSNKKNVLEMR